MINEFDNPNRLFANNLRELMFSKKFNQTQLSKELQVSQATVSGWLSGIRLPKKDTQQKIADYFGVSVSDLIHVQLISTEEYKKIGIHETLDSIHNFVNELCNKYSLNSDEVDKLCLLSEQAIDYIRTSNPDIGMKVNAQDNKENDTEVLLNVISSLSEDMNEDGQKEVLSFISKIYKKDEYKKDSK